MLHTYGVQNSIDLQWIEATLAANKFRTIVEQFWPVVSNDRFVSGYHIDALCEHLQAVAEGKIKRLVVNLASRTGSTWGSTMAWRRARR